MKLFESMRAIAHKVVIWVRDNVAVIVPSVVAGLFVLFMVYQWYQLTIVTMHAKQLHSSLDSMRVRVADLEYELSRSVDLGDLADEQRVLKRRVEEATEAARRANEEARRALEVAEQALYN